MGRPRGVLGHKKRSRREGKKQGMEKRFIHKLSTRSIEKCG